VTRHAFPVRPAAGCPRRANKGHRFVPDGDSADLLAYGRPDHGVTVFLGRCQDCGIALLSVGRRGSDHPEHLTVLELPDAALPED
jgi:hypothetical protein